MDNFADKKTIRKYLFDEIMKIEPDNSSSLVTTLQTIGEYANVKLDEDEEFNLFYNAKVDDIIDSDITEEELLYVRNGGWEYNNDKKLLIKRI